MIHSRSRFEEWLPAQFDGEFDWDFLKVSFSGTKIQPMDFDAVVERKGHFLVFETKSRGKGIDLGQQITLTSAWKDKGFTVIHVEGKTAPTITGFAVYSEWDSQKEGAVGDKPITEKTYIDLAYAVRCWFCKASDLPQPKRKEWEYQVWVDDYKNNEENC
jgi:hypothetical protein